jgi:hypothetical protein
MHTLVVNTLLTPQPRSQAVYLFNRETFFSEPERWAKELREEIVLPPPLDREYSCALDCIMYGLLEKPGGRRCATRRFLDDARPNHPRRI